jgi:hypothetical protein
MRQIRHNIDKGTGKFIVLCLLIQHILDMGPEMKVRELSVSKKKKSTPDSVINEVAQLECRVYLVALSSYLEAWPPSISRFSE